MSLADRILLVPFERDISYQNPRGKTLIGRMMVSKWAKKNRKRTWIQSALGIERLKSRHDMEKSIVSLVVSVKRKVEREEKNFRAKVLASAVCRKFRSVSRVLREIDETSPDSLKRIRAISNALFKTQRATVAASTRVFFLFHRFHRDQAKKRRASVFLERREILQCLPRSFQDRGVSNPCRGPVCSQTNCLALTQKIDAQRASKSRSCPFDR